ncbi:universal stress protein [Massilia sp. DWR3-1-1]|uniref:universal stress protein n=1 Tax=Massilia sp. DWR3-1-1 TaxID=2804559 RepID=UPI003CE8F850
MSYKSILVHACESPSAQLRYRLAAHIALAEGAQLTGIALSGVTEFIYQCGAAGAVLPTVFEDFSFLTEGAERALAEFSSSVRETGLSAVQTVLVDDGAAHGLPLAARYGDLLVLGQSHSPAALVADGHALVRALLVHAPCPVLVVPPALADCSLPQRPLIAWDGSLEASRAVRAALPLLRRAGQVAAVTFNAPKYDGGADSIDARLAAYLACHGIALDIVDGGAVDDAGAALLALAQARARDLIVMGSFGHSRFREIVLGGVTQTVLRESTLPLLMAR